MNDYKAKEEADQFLQLGKLLFKIRLKYPDLSEVNILQFSKMVTAVASETLTQATSPRGKRLKEALAPAKTWPDERELFQNETLFTELQLGPP